MEDTFMKIRRMKLISIIRSKNTSQIESVVDALYKGGIRIIEITMNTPNALDSIKYIKEKYSDILIGAGTVLDAETGRLAILSGADFLLTPSLDKKTIEVANRYNIPIIPGVLTPTEVVQARQWGAQAVKIFPASSVGSQYIKDLNGPLGHVNYIPVGGVTLHNAREFIEAGSIALGIGSALVDDNLIKNGNFTEITNRSKQFVNIIEK